MAEPSLDIHDALTEAFAEAEDVQEAPQETTQEAPEAPDVEGDESPAEPEEAAESEAQDEAEPLDEDLDEIEAEELRPVEHWTNELKEHFEILGEFEGEGRAIQEAWLDMHKRYERREQERFDELRNQAQFYDQLAQYTPQGSSPEQYVGHALQLVQAIQQDPGQVVEYLQRHYGLQQQSSNADPEGEAQAWVDPDVKALRDEVSGLKQTLDESRQSSHRADQARVQQQLQAFADETDAEGNLLRPHFGKPEVIEQMEILAHGRGQKGQTSAPHDLYEAAVKMLGLADPNEALAARKDRARAARDARRGRSAGATTRTRKPAKTRAQPTSWRESLEQEFEND